MLKIKLPFFTKKEAPKPVSVLGLQRINRKKSLPISKKQIFRFSLFFGFILLILAIFFAFKNNPLIIKNVNFKTEDLSCVTNQQLKNFLNLNKYNMLSLETEKLSQQAKERFICLESVTIVKKFPSTLEISASDRKAAAVIRVFQVAPLDLNINEATSSTQAAQLLAQTQNANQVGNFIADAQGVVIANYQNQNNLPIIDYYNQESEIKLGSKLPNDDISKTLAVFAGLNQQNIPINNVKIENSGLYINNEDRQPSTTAAEYIFSLDKDIERQLVGLQLILQQDTINSKVAQKIDLRFDKAIVTYPLGR